MADVFISYAREDREVAARIASELESEGLSVWWDRRIVAGQAFDAEIEGELDAAGRVLVLWSQDSVVSEWVKNEAAAALERGVLVPATIAAVRPPLEFRRRQAEDLQEWLAHGDTGGWRRLLAALRGAATSATPPVQTAKRASASSRMALIAAVGTTLVVVIALGVGFGLRSARHEGSKTPPTEAKAPPVAGETRVPAAAGLDGLDLAQSIAGTYRGRVIADSMGPSRDDVSITITRIDERRVRITSPYGRIGTREIELSRVGATVTAAGTAAVLMVDPAARPTPITFDMAGFAYRGERR